MAWGFIWRLAEDGEACHLKNLESSLWGTCLHIYTCHPLRDFWKCLGKSRRRSECQKLLEVSGRGVAPHRITSFCTASRNNKLLVTSASLLVTSASLLVTSALLVVSFFGGDEMISRAQRPRRSTSSPRCPTPWARRPSCCLCLLLFHFFGRFPYVFFFLLCFLLETTCIGLSGFKGGE